MRFRVVSVAMICCGALGWLVCQSLLTAQQAEAADQSHPASAAEVLTAAASQYGLLYAHNQAWHLRVSFRLHTAEGDQQGSFEEFHAGAQRSRQIYQLPHLTVTAFELRNRRSRFFDPPPPQSVPGIPHLPAPLDGLRTAFVEPVPPASLLHSLLEPGYAQPEMVGELTCYRASESPAAGIQAEQQLFPYPFCFGPDHVLASGTVSGENGTAHAHYAQPFNVFGRTVWRSIEIEDRHQNRLSAWVEALEPLDDPTLADPTEEQMHRIPPPPMPVGATPWPMAEAPGQMNESERRVTISSGVTQGLLIRKTEPVAVRTTTEVAFP
jgi:hypothetical protein